MSLSKHRSDQTESRTILCARPKHSEHVWTMEDHWCLCDPSCDEVKTIISSFRKNYSSKLANTQNGKNGKIPSLASQQLLEAHRYHASYMNYVVRLRVKNSPPVGFIIKMAAPSMQCSGNPLPAPVERGEREYRAFQFFHSIVPRCVPVLVYYDVQTRCLCTQEVTDFQPLSDVLLLGGFSQVGARSLGACLAAIHSATHVISVGDEGLRRLEQRFPTFQSMIDIILLFHYERPFDPSDPEKLCDAAVTSGLKDVYQDEAVVEAVRQVKRSFVEDKNSLIHGDLHIGSIIAHNDDFKLVDAEFARVGPCAYDVGLLVATLLLVFHRLRHARDRQGIPARTSSQKATCAPQEDHHQPSQNCCALTETDLAERVLGMCEAVLEEYISTMTKTLKQDKQFSETLLRSILGFTGCEMLGSIIGPPHFSFMDGHPHAQTESVRTATTLLRHRHSLTSAADFIDLVSGSGKIPTQRKTDHL